MLAFAKSVIEGCKQPGKDGSDGKGEIPDKLNLGGLLNVLDGIVDHPVRPSAEATGWGA
jgi:hypothetical protein